MTYTLSVHIIDNEFVGDAITIKGKIYTKLKEAFSKLFASTSNQLDYIMFNNDALRPRILLGCAGCVGTGVDSDDAHAVIRVGFTTSIINFTQEMTRCRRNRAKDKTLNIAFDKLCCSVLALKDFSHDIEKVYQEDKDSLTIVDNDRSTIDS